MAKQKTAIAWKIVEVLFYPATSKFVEKTKKLGRFTAATAREKVEKMYPDYKFKEVGSHGFGGTGSTRTELPSRSSQHESPLSL